MGSSDNLIGELAQSLEPVRPIPRLRTVAASALGLGAGRATSSRQRTSYSRTGSSKPRILIGASISQLRLTLAGGFLAA